MTFANINETIIHFQYIDNQQERTFVFINSLGTDFRIWDGVVSVLEKEGNILRYDKAGHGLSGIRNSALEIQDYADEVIGLMDYLKIGKAVIIGLSIGGIIGQHLALYHAGRIEKLVLSNTAPKVGTEESWMSRMNQVKKDGIASIADMVMKVWFSENFHQHRSNELCGYKMMLANSNPIGYLEACNALKRNDLTDEIHKIDVPTLCFAGTVDGSTPPDLVKAMADKIPNSKYILIEGVGHIPCVEAPEIVSKHIIAFVK